MAAIPFIDNIGEWIHEVLAEVGVPEEVIYVMMQDLQTNEEDVRSGPPPALPARHFGGGESAAHLGSSTDRAHLAVHDGMRDMAAGLGEYQVGLKNFRDGMTNADDTSTTSSKALETHVHRGGGHFGGNFYGNGKRG